MRISTRRCAKLVLNDGREWGLDVYRNLTKRRKEALFFIRRF
jgi:hypothetical protein